MPVVCIGS